MNTTLGAGRKSVTPSHDFRRTDLEASLHRPPDVAEPSTETEADSIRAFAEERLRTGTTCGG